MHNCENWAQASSRDVLRDKILQLDKSLLYGDRLRFTVHDEGAWSVPRNDKRYNIKDVEEVFAEPLDWAPGLPLAGDGAALDFYMKTE